VDVRLVATTNRDLKSEVDAGRFRSDLYYRLNVVPIRTPSLRERPDDIPRLVQHFILRSAENLGAPVPGIAPETVQYLQRHRWPGNVRELANAIERAVILCRGPVLLPEAFEDQLTEAGPGTVAGRGVQTRGTEPVPGAADAGAALFDLDQIARHAIERALVATGGNRTKASKLLGISERTLRNKLNVPRAEVTSDT
jgi:DNA-binding NtrC family response regulator